MKEKYNFSPEDSSWLNNFSEKADRAFNDLEEDLEMVNEEISHQFYYKKAYDTINDKYNSLPPEKRVAFLAKTSRIIEEHKGKRSDEKLAAQIAAYQDFLSDLMSKGGNNED